MPYPPIPPELNDRRYSASLFGEAGTDISDLDVENYAYFLDNVQNKEDLVYGLEMRSPFMDDALAIARAMSDGDFLTFKLGLAHERRAADGLAASIPMPESHRTVMLPYFLMRAGLLAEISHVPLGAALMRLRDLNMLQYPETRNV